METNVTQQQQQQLTLRVTGLGHKLTFEIPSSATLAHLKAEIERQISLPAPYQQLIARGKKLDGTNDDEASLESLGIQDRTSIMLLHNKVYATDQAGVTAITELLNEIDELSAKAEDTAPNVVHEMVTQICCKLDGIDINGSEHLRSMRKKAIAKAESIDRLALQNSTKG